MTVGRQDDLVKHSFEKININGKTGSKANVKQVVFIYKELYQE